MSRLVLSKLAKSYGALKIVDGVDLSLGAGEFLSLLGPSGCGKTTILRMIAGFIEPSGGSIQLDGTVISAPGAVLPAERRGMSMIFQSYAIWPNMTVAENVAFGLKIRKLPAPELRERVAEVLDTVQLGHLAGRYPAELSGGQQQRVALARAVVIRPAVLLLDEPLSNLDANLRMEMGAEIRRLHNRYRMTTVYVTHDQSEAMAMSDRIAVLDRGHLAQVDPPQDLYMKPKTRYVASFIGQTNLVPAHVGGGAVSCEGFSFPAAHLGGVPADGPATLSIRPHSIRLHDAPRQGTAPILAGRVLERTYMGDRWDYTVAIPGNLSLKAVGSPFDVFDVDAPIWLELDPRQLALVA